MKRDLNTDESLRIMVVTPKVANGSLGGAEYLVWGLSRALAERGHRVEVYTTCASHSIPTRAGYLIWNNHFEAGSEKAEGVVVHRFPVRNYLPAAARRSRHRMDRQLAREEEAAPFARHLTSLLEPGSACLVSGWYEPESWDDGPARWTSREARMAFRGEGLEGLRMRVFSPQDQDLTLEDGTGLRRVVACRAGEEQDIELKFPARDSLVLRLEVDKAFRPEMDLRELGTALRGLSYLRGGDEIKVDLGEDLVHFLETGREEAVFSFLAKIADARPLRYQRDQAKAIGPSSPGLEKAVKEEIAGFDAVIATHSPHTTMGIACGAAHNAGVPYIALPLFHPRDRYQYWPGLLRNLREASRVDASSPTLARILSDLGTVTFAAGAGLDSREFEGHGDPGTFRARYGLGDAHLFLWVGRKNTRKGYIEAVEAVKLMRDRGREVLLVMVGVDDDGRPVSGRDAVYLGPLERSELIEAYGCSDALILPSRDESFGVSLCEAWMAGKPVLGWERCSATRDLVVNGENGYLCAGVEELADAAQKLLDDPELAARMGAKGREMVLEKFSWEKVAEQYEMEIVKMRKSDGGR